MQSGASESCELLRLEKQDGSASKITILFMEGREDFGLGGASNATMEMCGHYSQRSVKGLANTSAWAETMLSAVGVEVIGQAFRWGCAAPLSLHMPACLLASHIVPACIPCLSVVSVKDLSLS